MQDVELLLEGADRPRRRPDETLQQREDRRRRGDPDHAVIPPREAAEARLQQLHQGPTLVLRRRRRDLHRERVRLPEERGELEHAAQLRAAAHLGFKR